MPRRKDQAARRTQVEAAAERALMRLGAEAVRVQDVAAEAGLSTGAVMYYFPTRTALIRAAFRGAFERFVERRREVISGIEDPVGQLHAMLRDGFPTGGEDDEVVPLYTGIQVIRDDPELAGLVRRVTARQVELYRRILDRGAETGAFKLAGRSADLAANLVALEDAYGLYAVGSRFPVEEGFRLTLAFAEVAVGRPLGAIPRRTPAVNAARRAGAVRGTGREPSRRARPRRDG